MIANSTPSHPKDARDPIEAAAQWLERLQRDDAGADDAKFLEWLAESDANKTAWDRARNLWDRFEDPDEDDILGDLRREALALPSRAPRTWIAYAAVAALVLILVGSLFAVMYPGDVRSGPQIASGPVRDQAAFGQPDYATHVGQRSMVNLSDGSKVTLDSNSAIDVAYRRDLRLVRLVRGQAFFDVAHDSQRPFRVNAGGRVVTALGTRFNIRVSSQETRIFLVQGSIGVTRGDDPGDVEGPQTELKPGQVLVARAGSPDEISQADVRIGADWRRGFVHFNADTLAAAVDELNLHDRAELIVRDPQVRSLRISGTFRTGDAAGFAEVLTALYPVKAVPLGDGKIEIAERR